MRETPETLTATPEAVQGQLEDAFGRPRAGAALRVLVQGRGGARQVGEGISGHDGRYRVNVEIPRHVAAGRHAVYVDVIENGELVERFPALIAPRTPITAGRQRSSELSAAESATPRSTAPGGPVIIRHDWHLQGKLGFFRDGQFRRHVRDARARRARPATSNAGTW